MKAQEMDEQQETDILTESELSARECKDIIDGLEVMDKHEMID